MRRPTAPVLTLVALVMLAAACSSTPKSPGVAGEGSPNSSNAASQGGPQSSGALG